MAPSLLRPVLAIALVVSACSIGDTVDGRPTITIEIDTPDRIDWRRTVEGIEVAGSRTEPDQAELTMLERAIEEIPDEVLARADVRTIYRIDADVEAAESDSLAFSRGPDIYLTDGTFARVGGTFELAEVLAHELAHTVQYAELTDADLEVLSGFDGLNVFSVTSFVVGFADAVGWTNRGTASAPVWELRDTSGTTEYGASAPAEDMADTVSRIVMGRAAEISPDRLQWAEDYFGVTAREFAAGKPFLPGGAVAVAPPTPLYDEARATRMAPGPLEARSWSLPSTSPAIRAFARQIQDELGRRGIAGTLEPTGDTSVARYAGEFVRGDGTRFLVELWDFRDAPGYANPPPQPVLTYVTGR